MPDVTEQNDKQHVSRHNSKRDCFGNVMIAQQHQNIALLTNPASAALIP